jgi:hypothetical protein
MSKSGMLRMPVWSYLAPGAMNELHVGKVDSETEETLNFSVLEI